MEQWKAKSRVPVLNNPESSLQNSKFHSSTLEKKKERKWTFGGLLKRISKNEATENAIIRKTENHQQQAVSNIIHRAPKNYRDEVYMKNKRNNHRDHLQSHHVNINLDDKKNAFNGWQRNKKSRTKARLKAKRDQYCGNSSSDEQTESSNKKNSPLLRVQSEDSINCNNCKNENSKKTRAARTERYMKRLYREDVNDAGNNHDVIKGKTTADTQSCKNGKHFLSDTLSLSLWTKNDISNQQSCVKLPSRYCQSYCSDQNLENVFPGTDADAPIDSRDNELFYHDKYTWPQTRKNKITSIRQHEFPEFNDTGSYGINRDQPPTPPPRSSRSRILFSPARFSLQNSDLETDEHRNHQYLQSWVTSNNNYCHSLDRPKKKHPRPNTEKLVTLELPARKPNIKEDPIIPKIKPRLNSNIVAPETSPPSNKASEHRRHSKNLEEALLELETIYNSLRLSDESLLDRAEQRSMEEYRNRVATPGGQGSIKSLSDTSSSYELSCRHANFDRCHDCDTRLKDDMAYRRMHQNDRPPSIDPSQSSLSRVSYLAASPNLGHVDCLMDRPKSRRGTPDLIYDDVVFRNITHANNTLKVVDPQPPFGIPLGPVTAASESHYLHAEPSHELDPPPRSLFIPKAEPDIVTDDLAFRSLRADRKNVFRDRTTACTDFLATSEASARKKRAVRSMSADLYGIIEKNSDSHTWYKRYIKLNKPSQFIRDVKQSNDDDGDGGGGEENTDTWSDRKFYDIDINGNRPKSMCQGRIQVCIPQEAEEEEEEEEQQKDADNLEQKNKHETSSSPCVLKNTTNNESIPAFSDQELSEYQQLCKDLECLIKKTSEKVKYMETNDNTDSKRNSLSEFIEWEKLLSQNDPSSADKRVYEPSELRTADEINAHEVNSRVGSFSQAHTETRNSPGILSSTVEIDEQKNDHINDKDDDFDAADGSSDHNDTWTSNTSSHDQLLCMKENVSLDVVDESHQDTNSADNSGENNHVNDRQQVDKMRIAKSHQTSTSSSQEDHKDLDDMTDSGESSEGRETTQ